MNFGKRTFSSLRVYTVHLLRHEAFRSAPLLILYRMFLWMLCGVFNVSPTFYLTKNGARMRVEPNKRMIGAGSAFVMRDCAEPELQYLHLLLDAGGVFVDCGANIGVYTLKAATLVGEQGSVIAFEPGHESATRLEKNVSLNKFPQVKIVRKALAEKNGIAQLYHTGGGPVAFSLIAGGTATGHEDVEITTLDTALRELGITRLDCFKIDVEGAESLVIRGALDSIRKYRPKIIFEINSAGTHRSGRRASEAWDLLHEIGYSFFFLRNGELKEVSTFPETTGNMIAISFPSANSP